MATRFTRYVWTTKLASPVLAVSLIFGLLTQGAAAPSAQQDVVRGFYGDLLNNTRDGRILGESGRLAKLAPVVEKTFDIPAMTRLAVSPYGRTSTRLSSSD